MLFKLVANGFSRLPQGCLSHFNAFSLPIPPPYTPGLTVGEFAGMVMSVSPMSITPLFGCRRLAAAVFILATIVAVIPTTARADAITIDASVAPSAPTALNFATGGKSPSGHELAINNRYFTLDGKPFFPVMGEFHYARYPANEWEDEILKMKAGGINIVSLYIFWIHHEETEGQFDWAGQKDLRQFVELCAKHGMLVWARIGPWDHGEVRNGGFPDWLVAKVKARRSNDPTYLDYVAKFYDQIGQQLKGLFWQDGGPDLLP
jgi:hypothetical protein